MQKLNIIGNLTHSPEIKMLQNDLKVCTFTVAVNRRRRGDAEPEADFFRVTAWRQLGENCYKYLTKGRKVSVWGTVTARAYQGKDGTPRAALEVTAEDVEFISPREQQEETHAPSGYVEVTDEELPY